MINEQKITLIEKFMMNQQGELYNNYIKEELTNLIQDPRIYLYLHKRKINHQFEDIGINIHKTVEKFKYYKADKYPLNLFPKKWNTHPAVIGFNDRIIKYQFFRILYYGNTLNTISLPIDWIIKYENIIDRFFEIAKEVDQSNIFKIMREEMYMPLYKAKFILKKSIDYSLDRYNYNGIFYALFQKGETKELENYLTKGKTISDTISLIIPEQINDFYQIGNFLYDLFMKKPNINLQITPLLYGEINIEEEENPNNIRSLFGYLFAFMNSILEEVNLNISEEYFTRAIITYYILINKNFLPEKEKEKIREVMYTILKKYYHNDLAMYILSLAEFEDSFINVIPLLPERIMYDNECDIRCRREELTFFNMFKLHYRIDEFLKAYKITKEEEEKYLQELVVRLHNKRKTIHIRNIDLVKILLKMNNQTIYDNTVVLYPYLPVFYKEEVDLLEKGIHEFHINVVGITKPASYPEYVLDYMFEKVFETSNYIVAEIFSLAILHNYIRYLNITEEDYDKYFAPSTD